MYEPAENELKEHNNSFGYLFDMRIIAGYFTKHERKQAATPPAKWITHSYLSDIKLQTVKLVPTDQPAQDILPPRQFCSLLG